MKFYVLILFIFVSSEVLSSPVARFLYEDAEAAVAKQDFATALIKLEESEQTLGKLNPSILYLRIIARYELLKSQKDNYTFFDVELLRKDSQFFMSQYAGSATDKELNQAREVYKIGEALKAYPVDVFAYADQLMERQQYTKALSELLDSEKRSNVWVEPISFAKIKSLHLIVQTPLASKEKAKMLEAEVKHWLTNTENGKKEAPEKLKLVKEAEAKIILLDDYLIAAEAFENKNYEQAKPLMEVLAANGSSAAKNVLGAMYEEGWGVEQDYGKAFSWYEKAAALGNATAMVRIGWLYHSGNGVTQDYAKALSWYEKAETAGNGDAMNSIGWLYQNGQAVTQDYAKAMSWYEKAVALGNRSAMYNIGALFHKGHGVTQDYVKALNWHEKAAALGDVDAMSNIGWLYLNGKGVTQDYTKALSWSEKAAALGNAGAMARIGWIYHKGHGVTQDYAKALSWYEKAAALGNKFAMEQLVALYSDGQVRDRKKAKEWQKKLTMKLGE